MSGFLLVVVQLETECDFEDTEHPFCNFIMNNNEDKFPQWEVTEALNPDYEGNVSRFDHTRLAG
jgi:hypothetical protein